MSKALLTVVVLLSSAALSAAPQPEKKSPGLLKASVIAAVPGIHALFALSKEQEAKLIEIAMATLQSEAVTAARKTTRDKSADRDSKRAARKTIADAQSEYHKKAAALLSKDRQSLVSKIYASVEEIRKKTQKEFRSRLKVAKGDRKALRKIRKEMTTARNAQLHQAVLALLSEEQRKTVEVAAKKSSKGQKKRRGKRGKKDDDDKGSDGDASKEKGKKGGDGDSSEKPIND